MKIKKKKDIDYFMGLDFAVILKNIGNRYYLLIPELSITADGDELGEAYQKLNNNKKKYFENIIMLNAIDTVAEPVSTTLRSRFIGDWLNFLLKILSIAIIFAVVIISIQLPLTAFMNNRINEIEYNMNRWIHKAETRVLGIPGKIIRVSAERLKSMPNKEKEELRLQLKQLVEELKPFLNEINLIYNEKNSNAENNVID